MEFINVKSIKKADRPRFTPLTIIMFVILLLFVFSLCFAFYWAITASFKINGTIFNFDKYLFPNYQKYANLVNIYPDDMNASDASWMVEKLKERGEFLPFFTYKYMFQEFKIKVYTTGEYVGIPRMFLNSLLYAGGCAITNTLVPCVTAYACARYKNKIGNAIYLVVIITMIIPLVGTLPSQIKIAQDLMIYDHIWGMWIMTANFLGLYFLVFYEIFKALPMTYTEAAKIDGASNFRIMVQIIFPLVRNTILTVFIIKFIEYWNDYQTPMIFARSFPTIARGLNRLMTGGSDILLDDSDAIFSAVSIPSKMATVVITALPPVVLFILFQKKVMGSLSAGGIKG